MFTGISSITNYIHSCIFLGIISFNLNVKTKSFNRQIACTTKFGIKIKAICWLLLLFFYDSLHSQFKINFCTKSLQSHDVDNNGLCFTQIHKKKIMKIFLFLVFCILAQRFSFSSKQFASEIAMNKLKTKNGTKIFLKVILVFLKNWNEKIFFFHAFNGISFQRR